MGSGQYRAGHESEVGQGVDITYEDEGPGNVVSFYMQVMYEEDEDAGDDDGGE